MKKFFILVGVWFFTITAVVLGSIFYESYKSSEYDETAVPYIMQVIPELSKWDPEVTKKLMAPEALASIPDEKFTKILMVFAKLGKLQSIGEPKFEKLRTEDIVSGQPRTVILYTTDAKYENGDATITLRLIDNGGTFEIYRFNLSSKALFE